MHYSWSLKTLLDMLRKKYEFAKKPVGAKKKNVFELTAEGKGFSE
jgi:hypothetical protein